MRKTSLLIVFLLFALPAGIALESCSFSNAKAMKLLRKSYTETYDIIVVPGVPFENGKWSRTMKARVYWSKYLYDNGITKNVMYSGSSVYTPYYEAKIMALYGEAIGISADNIFTETKAEHSTENIYYSYQLARKLGFKKIALASDPYQTKMLQRFTRRKVSEHIDLVPIVFDTLRKMESSMIDPAIEFEKALNPDFVPITERESSAKRFRGTLGKNIDPTIYQENKQ